MSFIDSRLPVATATPKWMFVTGWTLTILIGAFFALTVLYGLTHADAMKPQLERFGWLTAAVGPKLPFIETACIVLYLVPQTATLGAVLLTAYLGGAVATHARVNDPQWIMPVIVSIVAWFGLFFRDARVRDLLPIRSSGSRGQPVA